MNIGPVERTAYWSARLRRPGGRDLARRMASKEGGFIVLETESSIVAGFTDAKRAYRSARRIFASSPTQIGVVATAFAGKVQPEWRAVELAVMYEETAGHGLRSWSRPFE